MLHVPKSHIRAQILHHAHIPEPAIEIEAPIGSEVVYLI